MARFRSKDFMKYLVVVLAITISLIFEIDASKLSNETNQQIVIIHPIIVDGDTIKTPEHRIRLWGIDAPELAQKCYNNQIEIECGKLSKERLTVIVGQEPLSCAVIDIDRFKRKVARCSNASGDIGELMVCQGWALEYEDYSNGHYKKCQDKARKSRNGLWALSFTNPWEWRKGTKNYQ